MPEDFIGHQQNRVIEFQASLLPEPANIAGPLFDNSISFNHWGVAHGDWEDVVQQLNSGRVSVRLDHSDNIDKIIGQVKQAQRVGDVIHISTEIIDQETYEKLRRGYLKGAGFSLRGSAKRLLCAQCGAELDENRRCPEHGQTSFYISGVRLSEVSIVSKPAFGVCKDALYLN